MVSTFVIIYMLLMIPLGIYASRRVKSSYDFALAGRRLPFSIALAIVFATWFGAESFIIAGSHMAQNGFLSVLEDPFGASICLILVGFFFAKKLYTHNNFTIGDYFHERYNKVVATLLSIAIITTYFGWIAAQFVALGIILNMLLGIPAIDGMILGSTIIVFYTYVGGMWSVAITSTVQMMVIIIGLVVILTEVLWNTGGIGTVLANTPNDFFNITPPDATAKEWVAWFAAWVTIGLGSISQQDVHQRMMSAKSAVVAKWASISGGGLYFIIAIIPLTLGLIARIKYPDLVLNDPEQLLPTLILNNTGIVGQILFYVVVLSAIMSTVSGALLAPATLLAEKIIKPFYKNVSDVMRLAILRSSIVVVALGGLALAGTNGSIYNLFIRASSITLVTAFVPLVAGLYHPKANSLGALLAVILGFIGWLFTEFYTPDPFIPANLIGLGLSFLGMFIGILLENKIPRINNYFNKIA